MMGRPAPAFSEDLACFFLLEGHPCWAMCDRRTRPFSGRAFREHRTNVGVLPTPLQAHYQPLIMPEVIQSIL